MRVTEKDILAGQTPAGGWKRATLAEWGVPWPAPRGWKQTILAHGVPYQHEKNEIYEGTDRPLSVERSEADHEELLHKVVLAVINAGHASDLYEFPDVLAYFGAQIPEAAE